MTTPTPTRIRNVREFRHAVVKGFKAQGHDLVVIDWENIPERVIFPSGLRGIVGHGTFAGQPFLATCTLLPNDGHQLTVIPVGAR